jgi:hypothetical protein
MWHIVAITQFNAAVLQGDTGALCVISRRCEGDHADAGWFMRARGSGEAVLDGEAGGAG